MRGDRKKASSMSFLVRNAGNRRESVFRFVGLTACASACSKAAVSTGASCHLSPVRRCEKFDFRLRPLKNQELTGAKNRDSSIPSTLLTRHIFRHCLLPSFMPKISKSIRALARSLPLPHSPLPLPLLSFLSPVTFEN